MEMALLMIVGVAWLILSSLQEAHTASRRGDEKRLHEEHRGR
jgi:hypothetical protein